MAESSGFFRSVGGDRKYTVDFLAQWVASFLSSGVYADSLAVTAGENMQVVLPPGQAWINGYYYRNDGSLVRTLENADGVLNRKDTVVLRWDLNGRTITAQVLTGAPAGSPKAPGIVRTAEQYDLKLAEISIPAGTTAVTQDLIADTRLDDSVCGIVHAVVDHLDTAAFYSQIQADLERFRAENEADFTAWVNNLKDVLDDETAGNLLNMIQAHESDAAIHLQAGEREAWNGKANPEDIPARLPNPAALTVNQGYGGQTGPYDGSAAKTISVPHVTFHTAAPTATLADGELWGVY